MSFKTTGKKAVKLYDIKGNMQNYFWCYDCNEIQFSITSPGLYFLRVEENERISHQKLVITGPIH